MIEFIRDHQYLAQSFIFDMSKKTINTLSSIERVILLKEINIFEDMGVDDLKRLSDLAYEKVFDQGHKLITHGESGDELFVITRGKADVRIIMNDKESSINQLNQGDYFGEMALLEQSAVRSASIYAMTELQTLIIRGESFRSILYDRPDVMLKVLASLSRRIRHLNQKLGF